MTTGVYKTILRAALPGLLLAALAGVGRARLQALAQRPGYAGHTVLINEVCAKNLTGYTDAFGETVPWVELYNVSGQDINLSGYTLSNDPDDPELYRFPEGIVLAGSGNDTVLLAADGKNRADASATLHLNFTLHREDETLTLRDPVGNVVDTLHYEELPYDMTYGRRFGDAEAAGYLAAATPGAHNPTDFWQQDTAPAGLGTVQFSAPGGFYDEAFSLTLTAGDPDALILYTTDGSEPDLGSKLYTGPITVESRAGDANEYASQAVVLYGEQMRGYAYRYAPDEVDKCTVIRARLYKDGTLSETVHSESYWVGVPRPSLPVVSLSTDPEQLFGANGIYSPGATYFTLLKYGQANGQGNFHAGRNISGQIQILDTAGACLLQDDIRMHVSGGYSRSAALLKSLRVRLQGEPTGLLADVPGCEALQTFVLRGSGNGAAFPALHQDAFLSNYLYDAGLGAQYNLPVALFLEGEYWGTYTIRESKNPDFFLRHFGVGKNELICPGVLTSAATQPLKAEFGLWVDALDGSAPQALAEVEARVDVEEFIRYIISQMYTYNYDGLYNNGNNSILWRVENAREETGPADGRWRFLLNDMDATLGDAEADPFAYLLSEDFSFAVRETAPWFAVVENLFQKLWQSTGFRTRFAEVFRQEMATTYAPENLVPAWDAWCALLRPELDRDLPRQTVETTALAPLAGALTGTAPEGQAITAAQWEENAAAVRDYFTRRAGIMLDWLAQYETADWTL